MPTRRGNHTASTRSKRARAPKSLLLLLLLAVLAGLISAYALSQSGTDQASETKAPVSTPGAAPEMAARIDILGDSYVGGSDEGGKGLSNWTSLAGTRFYEEGTPVELNPVALPGSGYITRGLTGLAFHEATAQLSPEADVVLVFGSRNDGRQSDAAMHEAARTLYTELQTLAPKAVIIVVGPVWVDASVPSSISSNNQAMARAAADTKVRYVDALAEGWFAGSDNTLIGTDGVHPTNAGHAYLADKIYPILAETVAGLAR